MLPHSYIKLKTKKKQSIQLDNFSIYAKITNQKEGKHNGRNKFTNSFIKN